VLEIEKLEALKKALEAGGVNAAPGSLTQGSALQEQDLDAVMNVTTFSDKEIKLQKVFKVSPAKATLIQYRRQLDYGTFGGSAVLEGAVGQEETSSYVSDIVPMAYYVHVRRSTMQAQLIQSFDGVKAEDRTDADAAMKIAGDIEFDLFRGKSYFSNNGVFNGSPLAMPQDLPGMTGLDPLIRKSDYDLATQDLMFNEYGANGSIAINQAATLSQSTLQDIYSRAQMNHGAPEKLYIDPLTLGAYNKIAFAKERIVLSGSPQHSTGAGLKEQWVGDMAISVEASRFLSAKTAPARPRMGVPAIPSAAAAQVAATSSFNSGEAYNYEITAFNELGESQYSAVIPVTIAASGNQVNLTITPGAGGGRCLGFNVYRTAPGGSAYSLIGRVTNSGAATTLFVDLNNRLSQGLTGFAIDMRGMEIAELSSFKKAELARVDLTSPAAHYRFCCVVTKLPRFNILVDNILPA
jgi:hypothetical protein